MPYWCTYAANNYQDNFNSLITWSQIRLLKSSLLFILPLPCENSFSDWLQKPRLALIRLHLFDSSIILSQMTPHCTTRELSFVISCVVIHDAIFIAKDMSKRTIIPNYLRWLRLRNQHKIICIWQYILTTRCYLAAMIQVCLVNIVMKSYFCSHKNNAQWSIYSRSIFNISS